MATLQLITDIAPYKFRSLGTIRPDDDRGVRTYHESTDFPIGSEYTLTDGKFPFTDYKDLFEKSGLYHTFNDTIRIKIVGFDISCQAGTVNKYGIGTITVEKEKAAVDGKE
jgi:hypothetical protein